MGVSSTTMEFDGNAARALAEMRKIIDAQKTMEAAIKASASTAKKVTDEATKSMAAHEVAINRARYEAEKYRQKYEDIRNKINELKGAQGEFFTSAMKGFGSIRDILSGAGIGLSISSIISQQEAWTEKIRETARAHDELSRKVQVQTDFNDKDWRERVQKAILPIAQKTGTRMEDALRVVKELGAVGVDSKQATGPVLEAMLVAAKAIGSDNPAQFAQGVASQMLATKTPFTEQNVYKFAVPYHQLLKKSRVGDEDAPYLAKLVGGLSPMGIPADRISAMYATARRTLDPSQAETAVRTAVTRMLAVEGSTERTALVEAFGDKATGESVVKRIQAIPTIEGKIQAWHDLGAAIPEHQRITFWNKAFGDKGMIGAMALTQNVPELMDNINLQRGADDAFKQSVASRTVGVDVENIRLKNAQDNAAIAEHEKLGKARMLMEHQFNARQQQGVPWVFNSMEYWLSQGVVSGMQAFGLGGMVDYLDANDPNMAEARRRHELSQRQYTPALAKNKKDLVPMPNRFKVGARELDFLNIEDEGNPVVRELKSQKASLESQKLDLENRIKRMELEFSDSSSLGGTKIVRDEKREIDEAKRALKEFTTALSETTAKIKKSDGSGVNRNANARAPQM